MEEIWKDIPGFPGYQASTQGRIRSHNKVTKSRRFPERHWEDRIIKQKLKKNDKTLRVSLWKEGKNYDLLVCRIVASTFLKDNLFSELTVNHMDGNRLNNNIGNLEWCTRKENIQHGFRTGLYDNVMKKCSLESINGDRVDFCSLSKASLFLGKTDKYVSGRISVGSNIAYGPYGETYKIILNDDR